MSEEEYEDEHEDEEEVCDHEWEVDRVTDWGMMGSRVVHICVDITCSQCGCSSYTDGSWEFSDDKLEITES